VTEYDYERAARVGGFGDEGLHYGRRVAEVLLLTTQVAMAGAATVDSEVVVAAAAAGVAADLHGNHPDAAQNPAWLSAMRSRLTDMYCDLVAQVDEACSRRAGGPGASACQPE
jgi:hypothetical protein